MSLQAMLRRCDLAGIKLTWTLEASGWSCLGTSRRSLVRARARTGVAALLGVLEGMGLA